MAWTVEYSYEFGDRWTELSERHQDRIAATVTLPEESGPSAVCVRLGHQGLPHAHMRELRVQSRGNPLRIFYAFDPRRTAILQIGGDKTGKTRFYEELLTVADALYDTHIEELKREGLI